MALSPRFQLDDILGNEVVDFQVLDNNFDAVDASAAHVGLANTFSNAQTIQRGAATDPALRVQVTGDATPRFSITADGVLTWPSGSMSMQAGGVLNISGGSLTTTRLLAGAGTAALPSYSFQGDPDTGVFSASADVLGVAVGGVETNRINNQGQIRFNRTNARIEAGTGDDPNTPGERLVQINALQVTPGRLHASGGASLSTLQVNGTSVQTGAVTMSSTLTVAGALTASSTLNAYGGRINFEGSNAVYIQWRGDLGALYMPYGNGIYTSYGRFTGNVTVDGVMTSGRMVSGGYDPGWAMSVGGNGIASGRFFQRGDGGAYCYDVRDFLVSSAVAGSYVVQRDPNGYIMANYINMTSNVQGGKPTYVVGMSGDNYLRYWPASAVGPPGLRYWGFGVEGGQDGSGYNYSNEVTVSWSGYYCVAGMTKGGEYSRPDWGGGSQWPPETMILVNGSSLVGIRSFMVGSPFHNMGDGWVGTFYGPVLWGAGTRVRIRGRWSYTSGGDLQGYCAFIPTDGYPG